MNLKEYFKERLMEEIINEVARTDAERKDPKHAGLEIHQAARIKKLIAQHNETPGKFKSEGSFERLMLMGKERGMNLGSEPASLSQRSARAEAAKASGKVEGDNGKVIEYSNIAIDGKPISSSTPVSLTGVDERGRKEAEVQLAHDRAFRNKKKAKQMWDKKFTV